MTATRAAALLAAGLATLVCTAAVDNSLELLSSLRTSTVSGLATLTDSTFDASVRAPNRAFHTFVVFNARAPGYQCSLCGPFEEELAVLADSYDRQRARGDVDASVLPIVFARADIGQNRRAFSEYQLQQAPVLVYFAPTGSVPHPSSKFNPGTQYASELDAENVALFVRERTGLKIEIYRSPWGKLIAVLAILGSLGFIIYSLRDRIGSIITALQGLKPLWFIACVGVYFIAVSGALYDVIRGVPPFGYDSRTRKVIVVSPSSGSQYAVEGFMVGGFNIGCAMAALLAALLIPRVRSQSSRALGMAALALVFVFCYMQIIGWYRLKNPWYSVTRLFLG